MWPSFQIALWRPHSVSLTHSPSGLLDNLLHLWMILTQGVEKFGECSQRRIFMAAAAPNKVPHQGTPAPKITIVTDAGCIENGKPEAIAGFVCIC